MGEGEWVIIEPVAEDDDSSNDAPSPLVWSSMNDTLFCLLGGSCSDGTAMDDLFGAFDGV